MKTLYFKDEYGNLWEKRTVEPRVWNSILGYGVFDHGRGLTLIPTPNRYVAEEHY